MADNKPPYNQEPPPAYPPTQPQYGQQPPQQQTVILGGQRLGFQEYPANITCPKCGANVTTNVRYVNGMLTWIIVLVLLFVFFPLMCVPCCIDACKDVEHYCPNCQALVGIKKRLD